MECNPNRVWSIVYSYNRRPITPSHVEVILDELSAGGLLYRWEQDGKLWGYFIGIDKPGRLPGESRRGVHEHAGPSPDLYHVQKYVEETRSRNGFIYFIQGAQTKLIKIGFSRSPLSRLDLHQVGSPDILTLIGLQIGAWSLEGELHQRFANLRSHGEWFKRGSQLSEYILTCPVKSMDSNTHVDGIHKQPEIHSNGFPGFGLGLGSGLGSGLGTGTDSKKESVVTSEPNPLIPEKPPNYAIFRTRFKHVTGFPAGSEKGKVARFEYLASTYGEEAVLDVIAPWAEQVGKDWLKRNKNYAAKNFLEQDCEDFITAPEEKSKEDSYAHGIEKEKKWKDVDEKFPVRSEQ